MLSDGLNTLPERLCDVAIVGGGTGGVIAAVAAARAGAKTILVEQKGYVGGTAVEGGCALHSFFDAGRSFGRESRKVVRGIPEEFVERLEAAGACTGHQPTERWYQYDSDALIVDTEGYKFVALAMLREAGVELLLDTAFVDAQVEDGTIQRIIISNHHGVSAVRAKMYIDASGFADLSQRAGAEVSDFNIYAVTNSMGVGGIDIDKIYGMLEEAGAVEELARGPRSGRPGQITRVSGNLRNISPEFAQQAQKIGMDFITTTMHDNYLMFMKLNYSAPLSVTDEAMASEAEYELRRRQQEGIRLLRKYIPGAEHAFIARTSPSFSIRKARTVTCDYDMTADDVMYGRRFDDEIYSYGFVDMGGHFHIQDGVTFGMPYRAILVSGLKNLYAAGMMVTSGFLAHMSTRNTVSCMGMGQAAGTAAALCALSDIPDTRSLPYDALYQKLKEQNVWFDAEHPREDLPQTDWFAEEDTTQITCRTLVTDILPDARMREIVLKEIPMLAMMVPSTDEAKDRMNFTEGKDTMGALGPVTLRALMTNRQKALGELLRKLNSPD